MKRFVAMFDNEGFETIQEAPDLSAEKAFLHKLADTKDTELQEFKAMISAMQLRARFNPQRAPEIWLFSVNDELDDMTADDFAIMADNDPQGVADMIRRSGDCIYRMPKNKQVIS